MLKTFSHAMFVLRTTMCHAALVPLSIVYEFVYEFLVNAKLIITLSNYCKDSNYYDDFNIFAII